MFDCCICDRELTEDNTIPLCKSCFRFMKIACFYNDEHGNEHTVRAEIGGFAVKMEKKLQKNDWKGGWDEMSLYELMLRLQEEVKELLWCIVEALVGIKQDKTPNDVINECCDVANFAMMIADKAAKIKGESL